MKFLNKKALHLQSLSICLLTNYKNKIYYCQVNTRWNVK